MHHQTAFVLGAGFSAHAGFPLVRDLRGQTLDWLEKNKDTDPKIGFHMKRSDWFRDGQFWTGLRSVDPEEKLGFEELMIQLLRAASSSRTHPAGLTERVLRYACGRVLWKRHYDLSNVPGAYLHSALNARKAVGIVSFNWDIVCELSLSKAGVPWGYTDRSAVPVIKPHGSLNWSSHRQQGLRPEVDMFMPIGTGMNLSYMADHPFEDPLAPHNENLRYMFFPGDPEAPALHADAMERRDLELLWQAAETVVGNATRIVFIGYSLPSYDRYSRRLC